MRSTSQGIRGGSGSQGPPLELKQGSRQVQLNRASLGGAGGQQQSRRPWKESEVSPEHQTGGYNWSEEEDSREAEGGHASPTWVPPMLTSSAQHRDVLGMGTILNG